MGYNELVTRFSNSESVKPTGVLPVLYGVVNRHVAYREPVNAVHGQGTMVGSQHAQGLRPEPANTNPMAATHMQGCSSRLPSSLSVSNRMQLASASICHELSNLPFPLVCLSNDYSYTFEPSKGTTGVGPMQGNVGAYALVNAWVTLFCLRSVLKG